MCSYGRLISSGIEARNSGWFYLELNYPTRQMGLGMLTGTELDLICRSAIY